MDSSIEALRGLSLGGVAPSNDTMQPGLNNNNPGNALLHMLQHANQQQDVSSMQHNGGQLWDLQPPHLSNQLPPPGFPPPGPPPRQEQQRLPPPGFQGIPQPPPGMINAHHMLPLNMQPQPGNGMQRGPPPGMAASGGLPPLSDGSYSLFGPGPPAMSSSHVPPPPRMPQYSQPPPQVPQGLTPDDFMRMLAQRGAPTSPLPPPRQQQPQYGAPSSPLAGTPGVLDAPIRRAPAFTSRGPPQRHNSQPANVGNREGRWVDIMDRTHDGRPPRCNMGQFNASLTELAAGLMPDDDDKGAWQQAFKEVTDVLQARWPEGRVVLFGSAANGLSVRSSNDIDVCLELDAVGSDTAAKSEVIEIAGELLEAAHMQDMLILPKARVPVVKFTVPSTGTKVDVTVNNTLACINTKMLADYCAIDPRLAQLVAVVKHWAKRRALNDPYRGTLSSYCYVLMCIHLLQSRRPPVLPVLQALPPTFSARVGEWSASFFDDVSALKGFGDENTQTLAQLVWDFFEYWAWRHDYNDGVVSIRTGSVISKESKDWTRRIGTERHLLCVEDPFELSHDLGRTVDRQTRDVMRKEFLRAATLLRDADDPMEQLFEPYKAKRNK